MNEARAVVSAGPAVGTGLVFPQGTPSRGITLGVDRVTMASGEIEMNSLPDHRLMVHIGSPARGIWHYKRFRYIQGDVDIFPAGFSDTWEQDDPVTSLVLRLSPHLLQRAAADVGLDTDRVGLQPRCQVRDAQIEHIARALDAERTAGHPGGLVFGETLGLALAVHLLGAYGARSQLQRGLSKPRLRRVTDYIDAHLDHDLSLARLAKVAEISMTQLKSAFRQSMGMPVHQYVIRRRAEHAKELLVRGELPASQVALAAGFAHQSHMARWMRRVLGVTPSSLRRARRH
jgi:AraC family transcriptional regulator